MPVSLARLLILEVARVSALWRGREAMGWPRHDGGDCIKCEKITKKVLTHFIPCDTIEVRTT